MLFSRNRNRAGRRAAIGFCTLLIGLFFFASNPRIFNPLDDYSPLRENRLVSPNDFVETAALSRGFKNDGGQGQENFLATAMRHHVQVQRVSSLLVTQNLGIQKPTLLSSFLIRSPPASRIA
jgi:hypothetical protein